MPYMIKYSACPREGFLLCFAWLGTGAILQGSLGHGPGPRLTKQTLISDTAQDQ